MVKNRVAYSADIKNKAVEMKFPRVCLRLERSETLAQTGTAITTRMKKS